MHEAGYAIATYVLGIGDRHLDNLLLSKSGHCFHIDFGFILGRDPKGFVSPMRLTQAMVDGMGGDQSQDYRRFASHCAEAFNILRKSSNLILNLVSLMIDANIEQIAGDKDLLEVRVAKICVAATWRKLNVPR
jgi:phosphatidylinositol 3-kinase